MAELSALGLVHSPLVGPLTWAPAARCFRGNGYPVVVCSLAQVVDDGPPYYRKLAETAARAVRDAHGERSVVLVGHSGAGALLPTIAELLADQVRGVVFVDALLPHPGSSWFDTAAPQLREQLAGLARAGRLPPWNEWFPADVFDALLPNMDLRKRFVAELPRLPVAYFAEPAPVVPGWPAVRCAYVRLSEAYDRSAAEAQDRGWWVHRENADHLALLTQPDRIADVVASAIAAVIDVAT